MIDSETSLSCRHDCSHLFFGKRQNKFEEIGRKFEGELTTNRIYSYCRASVHRRQPSGEDNTRNKNENERFQLPNSKFDTRVENPNREEWDDRLEICSEIQCPRRRTVQDESPPEPRARENVRMEFVNSGQKLLHSEPLQTTHYVNEVNHFLLQFSWRLKPFYYPKKPVRLLVASKPVSSLVHKTRSVADIAARRTSRELARIIGFFSLVINLVLLSVPCSGELTEEQLSQFAKDRSEVARKWAPLVLLHPNERYFPSDVHSFLRNVVPRNIPADERPPDPPVIVSMSRSLNIAKLPEGDEGEDTYLIAPIDPKCRNCPLPPFLRGTKPSLQYSPPVYAIVTSCLPSEKSYQVIKNPDPPKEKKRKWRRLRLGQKGRRRRRFSLRNIGKSLKMSSLFPFFRKHKTTTPSPNSFSEDSDETRSSNSNFTNRNSYIYIVDENQNESTEESPNSAENVTFSASQETAPSYDSNLVNNHTSIVLLPQRGNLPESKELETDTVEEKEPFKLPPITTEDDLELRNNFTTTTTTTTTTIITTTTSIKDESEVDSFASSESKGKSLPTTASKNELLENDIPEGKIKEKKGHRFTVTYWMFYPFSQGKEVCTSRLWIFGRVFKPRLRNKCYGDLVTLNSHVGDWEHVSIYFEENLPQRMYVSTHTYGAFYHYDEDKNLFVYKGKDTRLGIPLNPKYPPIIKMDGTHPVLYSALGSHGLWGSPGVHRYENLVPLEDKTASGIPWRSWENIDIIDNREEEYNQPHRQWLRFNGKWGNPSYGCHKALFGSCDLASGPTGIPMKRENFPCHIPQHSTFFPEN